MKTSFFTFILMCLFSLGANAELTVEIVGGSANQIPIAIVPFANASNYGVQNNVSDVIAADLRRSGMFRVLETRGVSSEPHTLADVKFADWNLIGAQAMTVGSVEPLPNNHIKVTFRLLNVLQQSQLIGLEFEINPNQQRLIAHKIADMIYEKLTGYKGVFATRIAYVNKQNGRYFMVVADADGFNPQNVLSSKEPIISPSWSPDGTKLAYVSFEKKKPVIFVQSLLTGQRIVLANFKGNNSAPAWAPDGKRLAIVLTYSANSQIYLINEDGTGLKQLTSSNAIDTEPRWSPDGSTLYFTSNRSGGPQIYSVSANGGEVKRVTFEGNYNVSPRVSADGKSLTYVKQEGSAFKIATLDLQTGQIQTLTEGRDDESPSFAPNGRMILYATVVGGRGMLAAVSVDGQIKQRLIDNGGDLREPTWGYQIQ
jgi:TolB protein